ncbi:hypothetical protein Alg130_12463 [Pyrenophora tritici-repentis]|nr:hypothetical protein Alg130_12463 [Pyrenophora tritici-repentis]
MRFSCALASIFLSRCHRSTLASSASLSNGALFRLLLLLWSSTPAWKPKNLCQSVLDARNCCRLSATAPDCSMIPRAYTSPATCDVWPACSSAIESPACSSAHSLFSSPSSAWNAVDPRKNRR